MNWNWRFNREYLLQVSAIAFACFGSAHLANLVLSLGLRASPVWFPAGVGLAAILLYGRRLWLGIAIGIFGFGISQGATLGFAAIAALSSSAGALFGAWLLQGMNFQANLRSLRDVFGFALLAGSISPVVNATIYVCNACLSGLTPWREFANQWGTVWLGDCMGILVIAPVPLTWLGSLDCKPSLTQKWQAELIKFRPRFSEMAVWVVLLLGVSSTVFLASAQTEMAHYPLEYLPFPLIGWAALRLGQRGTVLGSLLVSAIAMLGVVNQSGPFLAKCDGNLLEAVLLMQIFVGIISVTALVLAAAVAERQQVEDLLRVNQIHLKTLTSTLECRVKQRTGELHQRMQELHNSNQVKDLLLHAVAHDLKTPLQGMLMVLNKLQGKGEDVVVVSRSVLERMIQSNENLLYLLSSLQESYLSNQSLVLPQRSTAHVATITQVTLQKLEATFKANNITVINRIAQNLPLVMADAIQIQQVLECLLSNAIKHNAPGLTITLEAELIENLDCIEHCVTTNHKMLRYLVQDNGVGLEQERCDRLFELHSRTSHNCHLTGIGLGLHRSQQLITAQGGQIGVISAPNAGATFWFTLPLSLEKDLNQSEQLVHTKQADLD